jgi:hypothetical protein
MSSYGAFCDEFSITARLYLKLALDPSRETLIHFLDRIRREYPQLCKMRRREDGAVVLDEPEREGGSKRFMRIDPNSMRFGCHNPGSIDEVAAFSRLILEQAPYHLSLSDLDTDHMEVAFAFDLEYRGNHDELVADALLADHPLWANFIGEGQTVIDCQPFWGVSLTPDCATQAYVEVKSRTSTFEVRTNEYEQAPLTVYSTIRRYWGFQPGNDLVDVHRELLDAAETFAASRVVPHIVRPLQQAIASRR